MTLETMLLPMEAGYKYEDDGDYGGYNNSHDHEPYGHESYYSGGEVEEMVIMALMVRMERTKSLVNVPMKTMEHAKDHTLPVPEMKIT